MYFYDICVPECNFYDIPQPECYTFMISVSQSVCIFNDICELDTVPLNIYTFTQ